MLFIIRKKQIIPIAKIELDEIGNISFGNLSDDLLPSCQMNTIAIMIAIVEAKMTKAASVSWKCDGLIISISETKFLMLKKKIKN